MKTQNTNNMELYFSHKLAGHGQWTILCRASFKGYEETFKTHCTNSQLIDDLSGVKLEGSWDEVQEFYKSSFLPDFERQIDEFKEEVLERAEAEEE